MTFFLFTYLLLNYFNLFNYFNLLNHFNYYNHFNLHNPCSTADVFSNSVH